MSNDNYLGDFFPGCTVPFVGKVYNAAGALADASTVVVKIEKPDGTQVTVSNSKSATGTYDCPYTIPDDAEADKWTINLRSTSPTWVDEKYFTVKLSQVLENPDGDV